MATSHSTSNKDVESLREHPLSAFTSPNYMALREGVETAPEPTLAPAPELPRVVQHLLKGFKQVLPEDQLTRPWRRVSFVPLGDTFHALVFGGKKLKLSDVIPIAT